MKIYLKYRLQNIHLSERIFIWIGLTDGWLMVSFHNIFNPRVHIFIEKTSKYFWYIFLTETQIYANDCVSANNIISTGCHKNVCIEKFI